MGAAAGFRPHTGWGALVVIGGTRGAPTVLDRRRVELIAGDLPRQPYHLDETWATALGRGLGPPWAKDQKLAAAVAREALQ